MRSQMRYTLDADTISEILRDNIITKRIYKDSLLVGDDIYINAISYYQVRRGFLYEDHKKRSMEFDEMCRECELIAMDDISIFDKAAEIHAELKRRAGKENIGDCDILIASIAYIRNLIVVTRNVRHFGFIKDFTPDLGIDNWVDLNKNLY